MLLDKTVNKEITNNELELLDTINNNSRNRHFNTIMYLMLMDYTIKEIPKIAKYIDLAILCIDGGASELQEKQYKELMTIYKQYCDLLNKVEVE